MVVRAGGTKGIRSDERNKRHDDDHNAEMSMEREARQKGKDAMTLTKGMKGKKISSERRDQ